MHDTAMEYGGTFFRTYLAGTEGLKIVDVGAQDVNGSLRTHNMPTNTYIGVDFVAGRGVDIILEDAYKLPFADNSIDAVVCSSCFEHSEFFWELFIEVLRILKPTGLFYLNAPSNGGFHRYPVDCWRFYPDSGRALERWAKYKGLNPALLESFTGVQKQDIWNDFVAVFVKDESHVGKYPARMIDSIRRYSNGMIYGSDEIRHFEAFPEDQRMNSAKRSWKKVARFSNAARDHLGRRFQRA